MGDARGHQEEPLPVDEGDHGRGAPETRLHGREESEGDPLEGEGHPSNTAPSHSVVNDPDTVRRARKFASILLTVVCSASFAGMASVVWQKILSLPLGWHMTFLVLCLCGMALQTFIVISAIAAFAGMTTIVEEGE